MEVSPGKDVTPQPLVWPVCPTCSTPWALRRPVLVLRQDDENGLHDEGTRWVFTRDCKHRAASPELHNADGLVPS